jgi:recombinational DNA repair ATPase RecF
MLSFGPEAESLPLESLNVLIGPNGSGKSNLLEAIALLRSSSTDFRPVISRGLSWPPRALRSRCAT